MPGKRDLTLLFGVRLLSAMGVTLILPVMPAMARTFGLSIAEAGMVVVCFTLAEATMTPVAGVLSDRFGRMAVLLPALLVFAGGGILCLFAESWRDVLICRVIQGIGAGPLGVLYTILAADMVDEKHLPRIMGRLTAVSSLGTIVYPVIGGLLGEWSWRRWKNRKGRWTGGATGSKRGISYVRGGPLASLCWYFCATAPSMGPSTPVSR